MPCASEIRFFLLGLQEAPPEVDSVYQRNCAPAVDTSKPVKPPKPEGLGKKAKPSPPQGPQFSCDQVPGGAWVRNFAHYDVQSILFDLSEAATNRDSIGRKKNITSGASAASQLRPLSQSTTFLGFSGWGRLRKWDWLGRFRAVLAGRRRWER